MSVYDNLPNPFFVLAPMDDVTDTVFRRVVAECAPPDLYFTEFVNVDGLQSPGRSKLLKKLRFTEKEQPLIARIWGKNPDSYHKTAQQIADGSLAAEANGEKAAVSNFAGIDINMGCPDKNVVRNGVCSAFILPENREMALEIIQATQEGAAGNLPVSVKTRLGFNEVDLSWHELLLKQKLDALTIHGRTKKQMSNVPADWSRIGEIRSLRDKLSAGAKIIGNGDVMSRAQGLELANRHSLDGIMIGRAIFHDPFVFAGPPAGGSPWAEYTKEQRIALYRRHVELFVNTWQQGERHIATLNKFCKIYIQGFPGAKELREQLMSAKTTDELLSLLKAY